MVFIGSTLFALQQLSGINAVFYFSSTVFKSAGVPSDFANTCVGLCNLFGRESISTQPFRYFPLLYIDYYLIFIHSHFSGSIVAMVLMDRLGRKVLLIGSFSGMVSMKMLPEVKREVMFVYNL